jgi:hypothetical protein
MPPSTLVLLKERLGESQMQRIDAHLRWLAATVDFNPESSVDYIPESNIAVGTEGAWAVSGFFPPVPGVGRNELRTYNPSITVSNVHLSELDDDEVLQVVDAIGYYPQACLMCDATTSEERGHRLLGYVVLQLADLLDAYIQLGNVHIPAGPGHLFHIRSRLPGGTLGHYTIVDAEYFRSFLQAAHVYLGC